MSGGKHGNNNVVGSEALLTCILFSVHLETPIYDIREKNLIYFTNRIDPGTLM